MKADRARPSPHGPPPTLLHLAQQAVGIDAECRDCRHRAVLGFEKFLARYGDDIPVAAPREMRR